MAKWMVWDLIKKIFKQAYFTNTLWAKYAFNKIETESNLDADLKGDGTGLKVSSRIPSIPAQVKLKEPQAVLQSIRLEFINALRLCEI